MTTQASKRMELVLSNEVSELYDRCWNITKETVQKLNIDISFLQEIKNPYKLSKRWEWDSKKVLKGIKDAEVKLNHIFSRKNNLPETVIDVDNLMNFLSSYIEKNFGKKINVHVIKGGGIGTDHKKNICFEEGWLTLHIVHEITHEMRHLDETFASKLADVDEMVFPVFKDPTPPGAVLFYTKLTGARQKDISDERNFLSAAYSYKNATTFLIHLYDVGLYKPKDERIRQNLEFSKFYLDKDLRRAFNRYSEGRAISATISLLESDDNVLKAYTALEFLFIISRPTPHFYSEVHYDRYKANTARKTEGFRFYYTLLKRLGAEKLQELEKMCTEKDLVPGIDIYGNLVVIDPVQHKIESYVV